MGHFAKAVEAELLKTAVVGKAITQLGGPAGAALNFIPDAIDVAGGASDIGSAEKDVTKELRDKGEAVSEDEFQKRVRQRKQRGKRRVGGGLGGVGGTALGTGAGLAIGAALAPETGGLSMLIPAVTSTIAGTAGNIAGRKGGEAFAGKEE